MHKIVKARNKLYNLRHAKNISKLFLYFFNAWYSIPRALSMALVHTGYKTTFFRSLKHVDSCLTLTWRFNRTHWAFHVRLEVTPLEYVPHPSQTGLSHVVDLLLVDHVIPDVDTCQFTNEALIGVKGSSQWILFLTKYKHPTTTNHMTWKFEY